MKLHHALGVFAAAILLSSFGVACNNDPRLIPRCASDEECVEANDGRPDWYCDKQVGRCACGSDDSCGQQEHCERLPARDGYCHPNKICEWNDDCQPGQFCDLSTSFCRDTGCTMDLQCSQGEVCDLLTATCVPGCRTDGDCGYRDVCLCEAANGSLEGCVCDATTEADRRACGIGVCHAKTCADDSHCDWGQICVDNPNPDNPLKICVDDERGPFCAPCSGTAGNVFNQCEERGNYCLEGSGAGVSSFCGVSCNNGESCPNGFGCSDILVPTDATCFSQNDCKPPPSAPSCEEDGDCPSGRCVDGQCAGTCRSREGANRGWCSCVVDEQCPAQTCQGGVCDLTGRHCFDDEDCRGEIVCQKQIVDNVEVGYCKIGRNCAPNEGVSCIEVRQIRGIH